MNQLRIPVADETGDIIRLRFEEFLKNYQLPHDETQLTPERYLVLIL